MFFEALAIQEGLNLAVQKNWMKMVIVTNFEIIFKSLSSGKNYIQWQLANILRDIRSLKSKFDSMFSNLVLTSANSCANCIAQ